MSWSNCQSACEHAYLYCESCGTTTCSTHACADKQHKVRDTRFAKPPPLYSPNTIEVHTLLEHIQTYERFLTKAQDPTVRGRLAVQIEAKHTALQIQRRRDRDFWHLDGR